MTQAETQMATAAPPVKRLVIFDWNRTLWSPQEKRIYPDVLQVLSILKDKLGFMLAVRSRTRNVSKVEAQLEANRIPAFMDGVFVRHCDDVDRRTSFEEICRAFKLHPEFITVVDDQQLSLDHPKLHGSFTVWVARYGDKFADISGDTNPDSAITCIEEILTVGPIERAYRQFRGSGSDT